MTPLLDGCLFAEKMDEGAVLEITTLLQKDASSAHSDNTKSLKGVIINWIAPSDGEPLHPSLAQNAKADCGFNHKRMGYLLCPTGMDWSDTDVKRQLKNKELIVPGNLWPLFVYCNEEYDPEESWRCLLRSKTLVSAFKHIFTSPSLADNNPKATRSGNAHIHRMTSVTAASITYIATQV